MIRYITDKGEVLTSNDYDLIEIDEAPFYAVLNKKRNTFLKWRFHRGYMRIQPYFNGKKHEYGLHRIIMSTLSSDKYFYNAEVNHKDEDKTNNKLSNLEWISHKGNCNHGTHNERIGETLKNRKDQSIHIIQLTKSGIKITEYSSIAEAQRQTGIAHISDCCAGKRKSAGGYVWHYKE